MDLIIQEAHKSYGGLKVLDGISFSVDSGKITALLGPSACGKTTLLMLIAGLIKPDSGVIRRREQEVSFVFQEPRLLDWLTVSQNIAFPLKEKIQTESLRATVHTYLERMGLSENKDSYPRRLSGGQRQRVSIARALAYPSQLLLMDEPFRSLDLALKINLIKDLLREWSQRPRTVVCVTHDIKEALLIADDILVLSKKPAKILRSYQVKPARTERSIHHPELIRLEQEIIRDLLP